MKRAVKLGLLILVISLGMTSCTMNDESDFLLETLQEESVKSDTHKEDADPDIEDPNGG